MYKLVFFEKLSTNNSKMLKKTKLTSNNHIFFLSSVGEIDSKAVNILVVF